jgi:CheY-like chemotaxis protein
VGEAPVAGSAVFSARIQTCVSLWFPDRHLGSPAFELTRRTSLAGDHGLRGERPIHVLLIEDDPAIAEMYRVQLEYDGRRVTVVATGELGYASLAGSPPDIVLLDLLLPDRSGLEIMADIKDGYPSHPPVVILSNYGEPSMIDKGFSLGALEYLVKSRVTPASVSQSIPGWIERARQGSSEPHN